MRLGDGAGRRNHLATFPAAAYRGLEIPPDIPPDIQTARPSMSDFPSDDAVTDAGYRVTADELRSFIERFERLDQEKKDIADQQKEVMAEAKGRGYDTKVMRKVIALRKRDKDDIAEEEAVLEMYKEALGMG